MAALSLHPARPANGLQPLDVTRHLPGVADLLEECFGEKLDDGGRAFIQDMRWLARFGPFTRLAGRLLSAPTMWDAGFVWFDSGRIVGTLTTFPTDPARTTWLVVNVAVHPNHRRQGIARALMQAAVQFAHQHGGTRVDLQVDDDNHGAAQLYHDLGFITLTTHTSWSRPSHALPTVPDAPPAGLRLRTATEWSAEMALAQQAHPHGFTWNHPLQTSDFVRDWRLQVGDLMNGRNFEHWVIAENQELVGGLIVQRNQPDGDRLIVMVHPARRGHLEKTLFLHGLRRLGDRPWPTRMEHPTGDALTTALLQEHGFTPRRTLRWLRYTINHAGN